MKKIKISYEYTAWDDSIKIIKRDTIIELEDRKYKPLNKSNYAANADFFAISSEFWPSYKKIKITILDVYKGRKTDNICISELLFNGFLYKD